MILSIIILIISFLLEGLMSNFIYSSLTDLNIFTALYTLITLVVIYPYFYNEKKYYILLIIFAILIDVVYTNTFIINIVIFIVVSFVIKILNYILPQNLLISNIMTLCASFIYHILSYIILNIINYNSYPISLLFDICINSILMTIIYTTIIYMITKKLYDKFNKKQIK